MNTIQTTEPFAAWRETVMAIVAKESEKLRSDPLFTEWAEQQPAPWTMADCLAKAIVGNLPEIPMPTDMPTWATSAEFSVSSYCEIQVEYRAQLERDGEKMDIRQSIFLNIATEEFEDFGPGVDIADKYSEDISAEDARTVAALLLDAARVMDAG